MFYLWFLLSFALHQPLLAALVVLVVWLAADRAWFRTSTPWKWFARRQAVASLRRRLEVNPHDRDARFELAELLVGMKAFDEAAALVGKNVQAGDNDVETLFLAGAAVYGSSGADAAERAETLLAKARETRANFRSGAIDLELGRGRLHHGRHAQACEALLAAIEARPGSVEAHVLLGRALAGLGKAAEARSTNERAWQLYRESPRFKRRQDRRWAWKAKPAAAIRHYGVVVAVVVAVVVVLPRLVPTYEYTAEDLSEMPEEDWNVDARDPRSADRD